MSAIFRRMFLVATLVGFAYLGQPAEAGLELLLDGVLVDSDASGGTVMFASGNYNGFDIDLVAGSSNSPGAPPQTELNITTLKITNISGATATLEILVGDTGFTFPPIGLANLTSSVGGTVTMQTDDNAIQYEVWVNSSNAQNAMSPGIYSGLLADDLSGVANGDNFAGGALASDVNGNIVASPFSMTGRVRITLGAGGSLNFATTAILTPVPEPGTVAMACAGLPLLALGYYRHRRRPQA